MSAVPWPTTRLSVFFSADHRSGTVSAALRVGSIVRLAAGIYTADVGAPRAEVVRNNVWKILARVVPDAVLSDRTAADGGRVAPELFVVSNQRTTDLNLPGVVIRPRPGQVDVDSDWPWAEGVRMSSHARTLVDNLAPSRSRDGRVARTLSRAELEDWLVGKYRSQPSRERWLADLRRDALGLAERFGVEERAEEIVELIGAVAGTREVSRDVSPGLAAHMSGRGFDDHRVGLFERCAGSLVNIPYDLDVPDRLPTREAGIQTLLFFEAYFSNFIEGTEFTIEEAEQIVSSGTVPPARPADGHDILGTYEALSVPALTDVTGTGYEEFVDLLRARHRLIMSGRPGSGPGEWKTQPNQAGSFRFVDPGLVDGTLQRGFSLAGSVPPGFRRAVYLAFVVSEVHPFTDGNGRVARASMNAELSAVGQSRLIVPTVWRNEYMQALRQASRNEQFDHMARVFAHAWRWTAVMPWDDRAALDGAFEATNALMDSTEAQESGRQLVLL